MTNIDKKAPVLVTGGSGYIASWIIKYLLEDGITVRTTVRSLRDLKKVEHLLELSKKYPNKLELFEADLIANGTFDKAVSGTELVIHTASPFFISGIKDAQKQLVEPALQGTRNVLESVNKASSVKRVVLTSSVASIYGDNIDAANVPGNKLTEEHWNTSSSLSHQPYPYSKTLAEKEAWEINKKQNRWDLLVINPSFVMGPSVSSRVDGTSVDFMLSMVNGKFKSGVPNTLIGFVDVRDVAKAHILAGFTPSAKGRHITSAQTLPMLGAAKILREKFGKKYPIPTGELPKLLVYLVGPFFGLSWANTSRNVGIPFDLDNSYSQKDLGLKYRPLSETFVEHIEQLEAAKLI
ncbi:SDR family oxidoreductase [Leptospira sp. 'Mane']|uniref:SDR family oxidoreductase n=1 Tax=Leptospira sp. 'Mane' TaxID=3387407 RepID=UPI00398A5882